MKYRIEYSRVVGGKPEKEFFLGRDDFEEVKLMMQISCCDLVNDEKYHKDRRSEIRMVDEKGRLYHYVTAYYPELVLPSFEVS